MTTNRLPGLLLVDPDPRMGLAFACEMQARSWRVLVATDRLAALEVYRASQQQIDVALVDLQLPRLEGGRLLAELGQLNPQLIRCAMSRDISPFAAAAFRRMCGTPLFTKPLPIRALSFTLHEMVMPVARR